MMQTISSNPDVQIQPLGVISRVGIFTYAVLAYLLGVASLGAFIPAMAGLLPLGVADAGMSRSDCHQSGFIVDIRTAALGDGATGI